MARHEPEEEDVEKDQPVSRGTKNFSVSYETLVKAFIGCLLALMAWSYNEITALRQNKADKTEVYREVGALKESMNKIGEGVARIENLYIKNGAPAPK